MINIVIMKKIFFILAFISLLTACKTQQVIVVEKTPVIEPEFEIVSIVILQADLVNTQFETVLKITNPNDFDLQAASIKYELHGNGMFWAEGKEDISLLVRANSSAETKFRFSMNFINMNRNLLDDVIAMRKVRYVFKGEAVIFKIDIPNLESFVMGFDIKGLSDVKPKSND